MPKGTYARSDGTKRCPHCAAPVPRERRLLCGSAECEKAASNARVAAWEARNPEKAKAQRVAISRRFYAANRDSSLAAMQKWRSENREVHRNAVRAWQARNPDRVEVYKARRRLALDAAVETFSPFEIFDRDGWRCQICGGQCLKHETKHRERHDRKATLDHIVPLSKGGAHTRANVRCAHFICNVRRGNRSAA